MSELAIVKPDAEFISIFEEIEDLIKAQLRAEQNLEHGYAKLGGLLTEVSEQELWRGEYESFDQYLRGLSDKYHRGRTQLYHYFSSVREMRPYLTEKQMNQIGISKLNALKRATKQLGSVPSPEVIQTALDPQTTVSDLKKALNDKHNLEDTPSEGIWFDLPAFYVTPDEKLLIEGAFEAAWQTDPVVQRSIKEGPRAKEAIIRLSMEFLSSAEVSSLSEQESR